MEDNKETLTSLKTLPQDFRLNTNANSNRSMNGHQNHTGSSEVIAVNNGLINNRVRRQTKKKRKRVGRACVFCQRSHMSCDESRPCKRCISRGSADQCHDPEGKRKRRGRKRKTSLPEDKDSESEDDVLSPEDSYLSTWSSSNSTNNNSMNAKKHTNSLDGGVYTDMSIYDRHSDDIDNPTQTSSHFSDDHVENSFLSSDSRLYKNCEEVDDYYSANADDVSTSGCEDMIESTTLNESVGFNFSNYNAQAVHYFRQYQPLLMQPDEEDNTLSMNTLTTPMEVPNRKTDMFTQFLTTSGAANNSIYSVNPEDTHNAYPEVLNSSASSLTSQSHCSYLSIASPYCSQLLFSAYRFDVFEEPLFATSPLINNLTLGLGCHVPTVCGLYNDSMQHKCFVDMHDE
ncbi:uncharacterized protein LOC126325515 isoform X2 [Schistocerca gregaria]|uniref:uncharacterized protein LOC126325515 isoform X2 n=1 Tax=Schistocerca gregaria TaxID=7010 RepID=UPI00211F1E0F|nr:uncharacterized protein LOC126325515 isoform X2 [Schistocerca gregaria]